MYIFWNWPADLLVVFKSYWTFGGVFCLSKKTHTVFLPVLESPFILEAFSRFVNAKAMRNAIFELTLIHITIRFCENARAIDFLNVFGIPLCQAKYDYIIGIKKDLPLNTIPFLVSISVYVIPALRAFDSRSAST